MATNHNKILAAAARQALEPLGLKRKGASRIWIDDHGWWVIQVEFQPSASSKGSYLNVGVSWLLYEKGHLTFDVGYRIDTPFIAFESEGQFASTVGELTKRADQEVIKLRRQFSSLQMAASYYHQDKDLSDPWEAYSAAVIFGLAGKVAESRTLFHQIAQGDRVYDYQKGLVHRAADLQELLDNPVQFKQSVVGIVHRARSAANLDTWEGELWF